jgi:catechol 2,3-dioxygenase-like lactoylglutathione lyase family enzyme
MDLGAFSVSLAVKDIQASYDFYSKLGFEPVGGRIEDHYLILRNGDHVIGLFQGMFERNILTFNPGWNQHCGETASYTDVREIQRALKAQGIELVDEADESTEGPASLTLLDPDGNPVLIDQHR